MPKVILIFAVSILLTGCVDAPSAADARANLLGSADCACGDENGQEGQYEDEDEQEGQHEDDDDSDHEDMDGVDHEDEDDEQNDCSCGDDDDDVEQEGEH